MLENTWYTVISPENCSTILWRSWDYKVKAAEQLKLTSEDMLGFNLVDDVIKEPLGGAQTKPEEMAAILKQYLIDAVRELTALDAEKRIDARIEKFAQMGFYEER
jgi:acetyl-CoA carboxylase carboxyl transferase subunit alpha